PSSGPRPAAVSAQRPCLPAAAPGRVPVPVRPAGAGPTGVGPAGAGPVSVGPVSAAPAGAAPAGAEAGPPGPRCGDAPQLMTARRAGPRPNSAARGSTE